ncbi:MAG: TfoX/Sxy family DNA transformation protein [Pseudobdellovibrionaceae bacterium]
MAKTLTQMQWIEELLPKGVIKKPMFGGFGYYLDERIIFALFESSGDRVYKNKTFDFEIWNGCLFPTERLYHAEIQNQFSFLIIHPILTKWLYLPQETEDFESCVEDVLIQLRKRSKLFGVVPKAKKSKFDPNPRKNADNKIMGGKSRSLNVPSLKNKNKSAKAVLSKNIKLTTSAASLQHQDFSQPMMFRDEPAPIKLAQAEKISDLKNLGPETEKYFLKSGIKTASQFIKLGWKKSLEKLVQQNPKNCHTMFAYALIGALANKEWHQLSEEEKVQAKEFTAELRQRLVKKKK